MNLASKVIVLACWNHLLTVSVLNIAVRLCLWMPLPSKVVHLSISSSFAPTILLSDLTRKMLQFIAETFPLNHFESQRESIGVFGCSNKQLISYGTVFFSPNKSGLQISISGL